MNLVEKLPSNLTSTCEEHGEYQLTVHDFPINGKYMIFDHCPECTRIENEKAANAERECREREEAANLVARKRRAGLRARHIECTFDNYNAPTKEHKKTLGEIKNYLSGLLSGQRGNLVMSGRVGTGKTHLAAALVSSLIDSGWACGLVKLPELVRLIKASWDRESEQSETELIDHFSHLDFLVIDEVGVQFGSDTEKLLVSEIIDNRYQDMLPTVLVSNLDLAGIKKCIGERCYDRLREDGGRAVKFDWESARGGKPNEKA